MKYYKFPFLRPSLSLIVLLIVLMSLFTPFRGTLQILLVNLLVFFSYYLGFIDGMKGVLDED